MGDHVLVSGLKSIDRAHSQWYADIDAKIVQDGPGTAEWHISPSILYIFQSHDAYASRPFNLDLSVRFRGMIMGILVYTDNTLGRGIAELRTTDGRAVYTVSVLEDSE